MNEKNSLIKEGFISFLFLGKSPVAPGTFGSFGALLLSYFIIENEFIRRKRRHRRDY